MGKITNSFILVGILAVVSHFYHAGSPLFADIMGPMDLVRSRDAHGTAILLALATCLPVRQRNVLQETEEIFTESKFRGVLGWYSLP